MIRDGGPQDVRFLREMLRHAYYWRARDTEFPITRYVIGWGRRGDRSVIAIDDYHPVGAAWYRLYTASEPGFGFVDEETPELTIGVVPARRGKGIGSALFDALVERARRDGFERLSLSVEKGSAAIGLYASRGFETVAEDGGALTMVASLGSNRGV